MLYSKVQNLQGKLSNLILKIVNNWMMLGILKICSDTGKRHQKKAILPITA